MIGIAVGGASLVYGAVGSYSRAAQGPAVSVVGGAIRQGTSVAVETLTVTNSGTTTVSTLTVNTVGAPSSSSYCYLLSNPVTKATVSSSCPTLSANPTSVTLTVTLQPGASIVVELTIVGTPFSIGSGYPVTVGTGTGAQKTVTIIVVPA